MNYSAIRPWLILIGVLAASYGAYALYRAGQRHQQSVLETAAAQTTNADLRSLSEFTFTERSGKSFNLKQLEGQIWVASFFFSSCPGACKQMNATLASLQKEMAQEGVKFVSISVDPAVDTPQVLEAYAQTFQADPNQWLFLTGDLSESQSLGQSVFNVAVHGKDHSDRLILIDRQGKVRGQYRSTDSSQLELFKRKVRTVVVEAS